MKTNSNKKLLLWGNSLAGIALVLAVRHITPPGAFNESVRLSTLLIMSPALMLFITLFTAFYMDMFRLWAFLVLGVIASGLTVVVWG